MRQKILFSGLFMLLVFAACQKAPDVMPAEQPLIDPGVPLACDENCQEGVHAYYYLNRLFLWGGADTSWHFDITGWSLELPQLKGYGYDRETFKALTQPVYQPVQQHPAQYQSGEPVIYLKTDEGVKVYPYILMRYHEVINDVADGQPVMIGYCYLADLAAVYSRVYEEKTLTFAVSGYTYGDAQIWKGKQGFVIWDRDTESLWWPLIDRGVSGPMQNMLLKKHDSQRWGISTWSEILAGYPEAVVLKAGQG
jgi:hypothetical protein